MKTIFETDIRAAIVERVRRLTPDAQPHWGRLDAPKLLCHLGDQLRMGLGDIPTTPVPGPLRHPPFKQLVLYWLPWPRGKAEAPKEDFTTFASTWDEEVQNLENLIDRFAHQDPVASWPPNPVFGSRSGRAWGVLSYRHLDHHLRQFGV